MSIHKPEVLLVKPREAWRLLGCSNTHGYSLLKAGELDSFRDGRCRKIPMESIRRFIARKLAESTGKRGRGRPRKSDAQIKPTASQEVTP